MARTVDSIPVGDCSNHDAELWYSDAGLDRRRAALICSTCPVRTECLDGALRRDERHGIWGGIDMATRTLPVGRGRARRAVQARAARAEAGDAEPAPAVDYSTRPQNRTLLDKLAELLVEHGGALTLDDLVRRHGYASRDSIKTMLRRHGQAGREMIMRLDPNYRPTVESYAPRKPQDPYRHREQQARRRARYRAARDAARLSALSEQLLAAQEASA